MTSKTGIEDAIGVAGTQAKLADDLGVTQQAVSIWLRRGWVPLRRAMELETLYGVPRRQLINPRIADLTEAATV